MLLVGTRMTGYTVEFARQFATKGLDVGHPARECLVHLSHEAGLLRRCAWIPLCRISLRWRDIRRATDPGSESGRVGSPTGHWRCSDRSSGRPMPRRTCGGLAIWSLSPQRRWGMSRCGRLVLVWLPVGVWCRLLRRRLLLLLLCIVMRVGRWLLLRVLLPLTLALLWRRRLLLLLLIWSRRVPCRPASRRRWRGAGHRRRGLGMGHSAPLLGTVLGSEMLKREMGKAGEILPASPSTAGLGAAQVMCLPVWPPCNLCKLPSALSPTRWIAGVAAQSWQQPRYLPT